MRAGVLILWTVLVAVSVISVADEPKELKDAFASRFRVGAAIGTHHTMGQEPESLALAASQFNAATPENLLKWQAVHPAPDRYQFEPADRFVAWGEQHGMFLVGHTLVWHSQTPRWVSQGTDQKPLDRDALLDRMKGHIETVVGRYRGRIQAWDVVNEAIDDQGRLRSAVPEGGSPRRFAPWYSPIGDDFIEMAFEFAHAADPNAELYYNDYNEWFPAKIEAISGLVRRLQSKNVRIDGIGLQGHWGLDYPKLDEIDHMLTEYGKLGVKLMVTELDITVLPSASNGTSADVNARATGGDRLDPYRDGLPDAVQRKLADRYAAIFGLFVKHANTIDRVTFWGVHDGHSWRNHFPVRGRTDYPLLFDRRLEPKSAFSAVVGTVRP
ncbi:MAG: endo-1,4-beta-xylanase [Planctomycetes bacterium]|nr:endo-1,4-beta-xylanase [Planctomycetota bacterium]